MSVAFITGGSRGIGRAIVETFAGAGWDVAFTYASDETAANSLVASVSTQGRKCAAFRADVRDGDRAREVVAAAQETLGPVDALINNAGIRRDQALFNMDPANWRDVIETNLGGVFNYSRALVGEMMRRQGVIVNVTSVSGITGMAGQTNYSASKAGVIGFTKALAKEVARFKMRVNAVAPGFIETDMTSSMDEATRKKLYAQIPMGKPGSAAHVAKLVLYLAGPDASYITGQVLTMDGGLT